MEYKTFALRETFTLGVKFSDNLECGDIVLLKGEPGAGKTSFVQGAAKGLGVCGYVNSPTFSIMNVYEGRMPVYHFDTYRLNSAEELFNTGAEEFLYGEGISFIEWGEMLEGYLFKNYIVVDICKCDDRPDERVFRISLPGERVLVI